VVDRPMSDPGPTSEHGPLARVEAGNPTKPGAGIPPKPGTAAMTVVAGFGGLIASLVVLGSIAEGVRSQEIFALDAWATPFLHGIASPVLDFLMFRLTDLGSSLVLGPIFVVTVGWLLLKQRHGAALFLTVSIGGSLLIQQTMKLFFQRPRPKLDYAQVLPDYSFPSGHTLNAVVFYIALALILWSVLGRRTGLAALTIAVALALGVGVSRIYLGFHYLTDVVGGLLAGIAWLLVVGAAFRARPTWWRWGDAGRPGTQRATDSVPGGPPPLRSKRDETNG
jgi:undecaprenyl-diphosphatase